MDWLIMDWLILLLVIPAILVPIVLLWGFAGCGFEGVGLLDPERPAPTNLKATAMGTNRIKLVWDDKAGGTAKFKVEREEEGSSATKVFETPIGTTTFDDTVDLKEGTTYFYTVRAMFPSGLSDPSSKCSVTTFPAAPSNVVAIAEDVNRIDLIWTNNSKKADQFIIRDEFGPSAVETKVLKGAAQPFPLPVAEGSEHHFRVIAFLAGFQECVPQPEVRSLPSAPPVPAKPLAFKAVLTDDQPNRQGYCLVQRIPKSLLKNKGTQVRITVRGANAGDLTIDTIYISQPATAGNPWDSHTDLTKVADNVVLSANIPMVLSATLGFINYSLDPAKDLLIAFDINATPGQGNLRRVDLPGTGAAAYRKAAASQAATQNRDNTGYNTEQNKLYLLEKIEVL